jgi:tetratricopeptide (TPR) repeat protein
MRNPVWICALALAALGSCASGPRRGVRRHPEPQRVTLESARAASQSGQWPLAASSWYEIYLAGRAEAPMACVEAARALGEMGDVQSARNLLDQGFKRYPESLELLEAHAEVLEKAGFRRAAEPYLERVLERNPDRLSTLLFLARLRVELSLEDKALPLLERRIALGGADALTWRLIARAQRKAGRTAEALDAYAKAFEYGENDPDRLVHAASLYVDSDAEQRGTVDAAVVRTWLRRAVELDPQLAVGHEYLGRLCQQGGDGAAAIACFERALELDPGRNELALRLGRMHLAAGNTARAAALAKHALKSERDLERKAEFERWLEPPPADG